MLVCYLDESTAHGEADPATCVAGYVATGKQWHWFAQAWDAMLKHYRVEIFHAKEFETEEGRNRSVFQKWSLRKRKEFQNEVISIIRDCGLYDVGVAIPQSVFKAVMTPERRRKYGKTPDGLCAIFAMVQAGGFAWDNKEIYKQAPSFVYERGDRVKAALEWAHNELSTSTLYRGFYQLSTLRPAPKSKEFPHLQAADYLAFNIAKRASHFVDPNPPTDARFETLKDGRRIRKTRYPLLALYAGAMSGGNIYHAPTAEVLERLLQVLEADDHPGERSFEKKQ